MFKKYAEQKSTVFINKEWKLERMHQQKCVKEQMHQQKNKHKNQNVWKRTNECIKKSTRVRTVLAMVLKEQIKAWTINTRNRNVWQKQSTNEPELLKEQAEA